MKKAISTLVVVITLYGAAYTPEVKAQDLGGALDLPMLGRTLGMSAAIRAQAQRDMARMKGQQPRTTSKRKNRAQSGSTRFRTSFAARRKNLAQFIAKVRTTDPAVANSLQQSFAKSDPIATLAPAMRRYNLRTDDVADSATAYLVTAWYGVRGRNDDPPSTYVNGVRRQMQGVMLSIPAFVSASNATKQQMAEALLVQMMIADALVSSAKGNAAQMQKVKAAIAQGARNSFQLDLTKIKLSSQGLQL